MSTFTEYTERSRDTNQDAWLGVLTWYSVSELSIPHTKLVEYLTTVGLERYAPNPPNDGDVFRRVSATAARKRVPIDADRYQNFLIRDVSSGGGSITRNVVCETVDANGKRLDYRPLVEISYDPAIGVVQSHALVDCTAGSDDCVTACDIAQEITNAFTVQKGCHGSSGVRSLINRVLTNNHATFVRDGVYFVGTSHVPEVNALEQFATMFTGPSVHSLPLIDDAKQRNMLREAFEAESVGEIDRTVNEIAAILQSGEQISHRRFAEYQRRYQALTSKTAEYAGLLTEGVETTKIRVDILGREMRQLLGKVKL